VEQTKTSDQRKLGFWAWRNLPNAAKIAANSAWMVGDENEM